MSECDAVDGTLGRGFVVSPSLFIASRPLVLVPAFFPVPSPLFASRAGSGFVEFAYLGVS